MERRDASYTSHEDTTELQPAWIYLVGSPEDSHPPLTKYSRPMLIIHLHYSLTPTQLHSLDILRTTILSCHCNVYNQVAILVSFSHRKKESSLYCLMLLPAQSPSKAWPMVSMFSHSLSMWMWSPLLPHQPICMRFHIRIWQLANRSHRQEPQLGWQLRPLKLQEYGWEIIWTQPLYNYMDYTQLHLSTVST